MKRKRDARHLTQEQQQEIRHTAIRMVYVEGESQSRAAELLSVNRSVLNGWCRLYAEGGIEGLCLKKRGRRPQEQAKLQGWQCSAIIKIIKDKMPDQLQMPFVLWTRAAVRDYIDETYGITFSLTTMGNYLKKWGFTAQKPTRKAYNQNNVAVKKWVEIEYPKIAAKAKKDKANIFWADEGKVTNEVHAGKSYAPKGQTPIVKETAKKIKLNHISAVTNRGDMRFMTYTSRMSANKYILFLDRLIRSHEQKVYLIADNLPVHHANKVKAWAEDHKDEIELYYIPSYSPELNPDEYLNRDIKKNVHMKKAPKNLEQLKSNVMSFFRSVQKQPDRVMKYFSSRHVAYCR